MKRIALLSVLIGLLAALGAFGYLLSSGGCTPSARQQSAETLVPIVGAVVCQQVTTDPDGRQICQVTADALGKLAPLLRLSQSCPGEASSAVALASASVPLAPVASRAAGGGPP